MYATPAHARTVAAAALSVMLATGEAVAGDDCPATGGRLAHVTATSDSTTLVLDDGTTVRLAGILAPTAPRFVETPEQWPPAMAARAALVRLAEGRAVRIVADAPADRHGRIPAQVFLADVRPTEWLQQVLVVQGHAMVHPRDAARRCSVALIPFEATARMLERGLWNGRYYGVQTADRTDRLLNRVNGFVLVEGRVHEVARTSMRIYLNFGDDWRSDFTASLSPSTGRLFTDSGISLEALAGTRVRVRGWIESYNGPFVDIAVPEQIEVLDARR